MLISYYANKKRSPKLPSWQPSLISFNAPIDSGSIKKPCTLKFFQVPILAPGRYLDTLRNMSILIHSRYFENLVLWQRPVQSHKLVACLKRDRRTWDSEWKGAVFIFGTACQIYCYGRYCVRRSVSPQVPENPSGPLVDNFIVLPCVAFGVACVKLLPGVDRWNSLDDPRVIGPCHCEVWGWPRH